MPPTHATGSNPRIVSPAEIGALVRRTRKALGLTQAQVAGYSGLSERFLVELENGRTTGSMSRIHALLLQLNIHVLVGDQPLKQVAPAIRQARKALKFTQVDCAGFLGMGLSTLKAIEKGHEGVSLLNVFRASEGLGLHWRVVDTKDRQQDR